MTYELFLYNKKRMPSYYTEAVCEYRKRLSRYCKTDYVLIKKEKLWLREWEKAQKRILILPGRRSVPSERFSEQLSKWEMEGPAKISFFIPDITLQEGWYADADQKLQSGSLYYEILNLSEFTMEPGMTGMILLEQIYRGYRILNHHPYHK